MSIFEIHAEKTTSELIAALPIASEIYSYICSLVAVDQDTILTFGQDGVVTRLVRKNDSAGFKIEKSRRVIINGTNGGSLALDPKSKTAFLVYNGTSLTRNIIAFDSESLKSTSTLGDDMGLAARPAQIAWVPTSPPLLAIGNGSALSVDGKDSNSRRIIGLHFQSSFREIQPALKNNLPDEKSFSLIVSSNKNNAWLSALDAMVFDPEKNRFLVSSRTSRKGMNIYSVPMSVLAKGALTLDQLTPILTVPTAIVSDLAVVGRLSFP